ncbi:MAG: CapA family protein, partial [Gaiellales bacterium]
MSRPANHRRVIWRRRAVAVAVAAAMLVGGVAAARTRSGPHAAAAATTDTTRTAPATTRPRTGTPVSIEWVGDTVLGSSYGMPPDGGKRSMAAVTRQLQSADLTWGNLEEALSTASGSKCGSSSPNCFAFQAPPSYASLLHTAGFDLMNTANNHAFDFGAAGRAQTIAALKQAHVDSTGAPNQITVLKRHGTTVAFVGFAP